MATGMEMMMKNLGFDPDTLMEKLKSSIETNPQVQEIMKGVQVFAINVNTRIANIEASQTSIHAKLDSIMQAQVEDALARLPKPDSGSSSPVFPAADDGLLALLAKTEKQTPQAISLVSQPKPAWAESLDVHTEPVMGMLDGMESSRGDDHNP